MSQENPGKQPKPSEIFRERLKEAREQRGWSQSAFGRRLGLPPSSVAHFESGSRKPSFNNLQRLASALEVTTDYLLGRVDTPELSRDADPVFRDVAKLTEEDRDIARGFLEFLAKRNADKKKER